MVWNAVRLAAPICCQMSRASGSPDWSFTSSWRASFITASSASAAEWPTL